MNNAKNIFTVTETCYGTWRFYCSCWADSTHKAVLREFSIWGGNDSRNGEMIGFEVAEENMLLLWNILESEGMMVYRDISVEVEKSLVEYRPF